MSSSVFGRYAFRVNPPATNNKCGLFATISSLFSLIEPEPVIQRGFIREIFDLARRCCPDLIWDGLRGQRSQKMLEIQSGRHDWKTLAKNRLNSVYGQEFKIEGLTDLNYQMMILFSTIATTYQIDIEVGLIDKILNSDISSEVVVLRPECYSAFFRPEGRRIVPRTKIYLGRSESGAHFYWLPMVEESDKYPEFEKIFNWVQLAQERQRQYDTDVFPMIKEEYEKYCDQVSTEASEFASQSIAHQEGNQFQIEAEIEAASIAARIAREEQEREDALLARKMTEQL